MTKQRNRRIIQVAEQVRERSASRQPRFSSQQNGVSLLDSVFSGNLRTELMDEPAYGPNTMLRDTWMANFWRKEPHLAGVLNTMVDIDKNRGWSMTGGRNQVRFFSNVLYTAESGRGWRHYTSLQALAYYSTDIGAITEIGRELPNAKSRFNRIWHTDSTRCSLLAHQTDENPDLEVLQYEPTLGGGIQKWKSPDFWRTVSMPDLRDEYHGSGWCAVSRCLELTKLLIAVFMHDREQLGAAAPRGFMTLNGYTDEQWTAALKKRKEERDNAGLLYYNDVMVLTSNSLPIDLKLTSLSQLPANFDLEKFVQTMMQGYALAFGIDVAEVYSVRAGAALGIGTQSQVQSAKARTKGENSFWLTHQENVQRELPETIDFAVDQRSDEGDKVAIEARQLEADVIISLYEATPGNKKPTPAANGATNNAFGKDPQAASGDPAQAAVARALANDPSAPGPDDEPLITRDEARRAIIEGRVLPKGILSDDNATSEITDLGIERTRVRELAKVRMAAERWPDQPIIQRDHLGRERELFRSGEELLARQFWHVIKPEPIALPARIDDDGAATP